MRINERWPLSKVLNNDTNYYENKLMFEDFLIGAMTFLNGSKGEQSGN